MVAISKSWYNGSYTMAAKPIKSLKLHYTMIQFSIMGDISGTYVICILYVPEKNFIQSMMLKYLFHHSTVCVVDQYQINCSKVYNNTRIQHVMSSLVCQ